MVFIGLLPLIFEVFFYFKALSDDNFISNSSDQFNPIYYFLVIMVIYAINNTQKFYFITYLIYVSLGIGMNLIRVIYVVLNEVDFRLALVDFSFLLKISLYHIPSVVIVVMGIVLLNQMNKETHDGKLTTTKNVG